MLNKSLKMGCLLYLPSTHFSNGKILLTCYAKTILLCNILSETLDCVNRLLMSSTEENSCWQSFYAFKKSLGFVNS